MADESRLKVYKASLLMASTRYRAKKLTQVSNATIDEWLHHFKCGGDGILRVDKDERRRRDIEIAMERYRSDPEYREKCKEKARQHHIDRPWVMLARKHRRDARIAGVVDDGSVTSEVLKEMWITTNDCLYCGRGLNRFNKSVEHMHPMSKGGCHCRANVVIVCAACNERKRQRWFDEWVEMIEEPHRSKAHDVFIIQFSGSRP
jgi:5-methylcytosine-specific restriction endonuclease McrA